jgi:hypothetical protein
MAVAVSLLGVTPIFWRVCAGFVRVFWSFCLIFVSILGCGSVCFLFV